MAVLQFAKDPNTQTLKLVVVLVAGALLGALASDFASNRPLFLLQGSQVGVRLPAVVPATSAHLFAVAATAATAATAAAAAAAAFTA